ncbi:MAG TPA: Omp28-related outer membrane protein, partial [Bacteroidia bacterium]|nr:Omp28-related outer membrane protein [Bacteroidia bacterium]
EKAKVKAAVDAHMAAPVVANTGFTTAVSGDQFVIETKTNFFAEGNGDYYVSVYVLEDNVVGKQSGHPQTPNVTHHHVLRGAATLSGRASAKTFGEKIASGTVAAGTSVYKKFIFDIGENHNTANYEVVTVIWKKNGTKYAFVNANSNQ